MQLLRFDAQTTRRFSFQGTAMYFAMQALMVEIKILYFRQGVPN
jgi:hypothetical protein